ncbi:MAG: hypothetical protein M3Z05_00735 [Gemmatimonadota bacterium]|nr:hypothetical protein [Gemmatimonadota bacterium]
MLRRSLTALSLTLVAAGPLAAQAKMGKMDMDKKVEGGALPTGWMGRTDNKSSKIGDAKFVTMGKGYHVTSGPAAIYWTGKDMASGPFTASVTMTQTKAPSHPEAYGIFFGGKKLEGADQTYFYFLVRGDGKFLLNHRAGAVVHKIVDWTENSAVKKADAKGAATNTLMVDASKADSVRLKVNGVQVAALPASAGNPDGVVGLRVNHNLDVHVGDFDLSRKK